MVSRNIILEFGVTAIAILCTAEVIAISSAGLRDQFALLWYSLPFSFAASSVLCPIARALSEWRVTRSLVLIAVGSILGFGWTLAVMHLLGPWMGAFTIPVLRCWVAGGACGGLVATMSRRGLASSALAVLAAVCLSFILSIVFNSMAPTVPAGHRLTFIFIRYTPTEYPSKLINPLGRKVLTRDEIGQLKALFKSGLLTVELLREFEDEKGGKAIFVLRQPVVVPISFGIPDSTGFYIQTETGWDQHPTTMPSALHNLTLSDEHWKINGKAHIATAYWIQFDNRGSGGQILDWSENVVPPVTQPHARDRK